MSRFWSPGVAALQPYVAGEQPQHDRLLKLNTNESPLSPGPAVQRALQDFSSASLRLYPDPDSTALRDAIAAYHGVERENVFVGNGSDEVLAHAFYAFFRQPKPLLFPDITYSFYPVYCGLYDIDYQRIPLADDYSIDLDQYPADNGGVIFANPNAPTAMLLEQGHIEALLQRNQQSVVIVDEAYIDFAPAGSTMAAQIDRYPNLLVTRTLSKSRALAGLRLGYALGSAELIDGLQRVKDSFNSYPVDSLASALALASFADDEYFQTSVASIVEQREWLQRELAALGMESLPSGANFLLVRAGAKPAAELFSALRSEGVIVRYFDKPRLNDFLRITVGDAAGNQRLIETLKQLLNA